METYFPALDQYDLDTILMQMHEDVTTRKILLVGHSQGAVYANKIYEYLTTHGMPAQDVAVYGVATPDSYVAGGGAYITYELDDIIRVYATQLLRGNLLPANATFSEWFNSTDNAGSPPQGHGFIDMYLGGFGTRMVGEMRRELAALKAAPVSAEDGCFDAPQNTLARKALTGVFGVSDFYTGAIASAAVQDYQYVAAAVGAARSGVAALSGAFGSLASVFGWGDASRTQASQPAAPGLSTAAFALVKAVAGSSLNLDDYKDLVGASQGGAVVTALPPEPPPASASQGEVEGAQTERPDEPLKGPLIPFPSAPGLVSPGYGGGGEPAVSTAVVSVSDPATSTATSTPPAPVSIDPPAVAAVSSDGASYSSFDPSPVAIKVTFNTPMSTSSISINGAAQVAGDCGDGDAKTYCIAYVLPQIEPATLEFVSIDGVQEITGVVMATDATHKFVVDTLGPLVTVNAIATNNPLPTIAGGTSDNSRPVEVSVNGAYYSAVPSGSTWSVSLPVGSELADGSYVVFASSTDQVGNPGLRAQGTLLVDTIAPTIAITGGPAEGGTVASTTSVSIDFTVNDALTTSAVCAFDADLILSCGGSASATLPPGSHTFTLIAHDAAGNGATLVRNFLVE